MLSIVVTAYRIALPKINPKSFDKRREGVVG